MDVMFPLIWLAMAASVAFYVALSRRLSHWSKERKSQWVYQAWGGGCVPLALRFSDMESLTSWPYLVKLIAGILLLIAAAVLLTALTGMISKRLGRRGRTLE